MHNGCALAKGRQQQHAVGNAFRTGQGDGARSALQCGKVEEGGAEHALHCRSECLQQKMLGIQSQ